MERQLGRTGIRVFPVGPGATPLSLKGRPDEKAAVAVIHAALDAGVTFIDTADVYCMDDADTGHNERLIAKALHSGTRRGTVTVATKGGMVRPRGAWEVDARPERLRAACERSLKALGVETIALYQLHGPDGRVPFAESVGALARLKEEGKILHAGLSNVTAEQLDEAQRIVRIESVQNECSPATADDTRNGLIRACAKQGVTYIAHSPAGGHFGHRALARDPALVKLARAHGVSPWCVAIAWLLHQGDSVVPIPGASRPASIQDSVTAVDVRLSPEDVRVLGAIG